MNEKDQLCDILDKAAQASRKALIVLPIVGGVFALAGALMYFLSESDNVQTGGLIFLALGGFLGIVIEILLVFSFRETVRRAAHIRALLDRNPQSLRWAYIHEQRNNNVTTVSVKLFFDDATEFQVVKSYLPSEPEAFLLTLRGINPDVRLGYSEELKKEYLDGGAAPGGETRMTKQKLNAKRNAAWRWAVPGLCLLGVAPLYYSMISGLEEKGGTIRVKWYLAVIYESMGLTGGTIFFCAIGGILLLIGIPKLIIAYSKKVNA